MWECENINDQVATVLKQYPKLTISKEDITSILLRGTIDVYRAACDYVLQQQYEIEILIPKDSEKLPIVFDCGNSISDTYPHKYKDGALCLETDTFIKNRFVEGFDLITWMDEFVEPYYFSYEFFTRYGYFPFGERPHGLEGLLNTYQEFFGEDDPSNVCKLLVFAAEQNYRGHIACACGSGKKLRQCHGPALLPYMRDPRRLKIIRGDLQYLRKELTAYEQAKRNRN